MPKTTWDNLELLKKARSQRGLAVPQLDEIMDYLSRRREELRGEEDAGK
jgi:hypothetical protein